MHQQPGASCRQPAAMRSRLSAKPAAILTTATLVVAGCSWPGAVPDRSGNGADRAFAAAMIAHHESAVYLAGIARDRGTSRFVRQFASELTHRYDAELVTLRARDVELANRRIPVGARPVDKPTPGMEDAERLRDVEPFDPAFLELADLHGQRGVALAKEQLAGGSDPLLRRLAARMIAAYNRDIERIQEHR